MSRAKVTSRCAIRINSNLIGSRALALSDPSASLHGSSVFRQNYQFATHREYMAKLEADPEWQKVMAEVRADREPLATVIELRMSEEIEV